MRLALCLLSAALLPAATCYADPAKGKIENDGSVAAPWPGLAASIEAGLLKKLKGGDTLLLRSGNHGSVAIDGDNEAVITIAADAEAKPQIERLVVNGRKWLIKGLAISPTFAKEPYKGTMASLGEQRESSDLVLQDCFLYTALNNRDWTAKQWMSANSGINLGRHGKKLVARNNYILNTRFALNICGFDSVAEGNIISDYSADGIRMTRDGAVARRNVIKNCYVGPKDGDDNHDDGIQCFLFNKGTGTIKDFTINENLIISQEDPAQPFPHAQQGIGAFDGPLVNFTVKGNVIRSKTWHGVALFDAQGCTVNNNACWIDAGSGARPWVMFGTKPKVKGVGTGNVAKNNMACDFKFKDAPNLVKENNIPVTPEKFQARFDELRAEIDKEFGRYHPVAGFARLGTEKGKYVPPAATSAPAPAAPPAK